MLDFDIKRFASIDSTNTYALKNILRLPDNTVIIADIQTNGRGSHGRLWTSDSAANIYASFVIKPDTPYTQLPVVNFSQFFSVIVADVFSSYGANAQIKWPNDVLINGKKCAGILCEASFDGTKFNGLAVGLGINIGDNPSDRLVIKQPASSLSNEIKKPVEKDAFFLKVLELYSAMFNSFSVEGFLSIKESYMRYFSCYMNKKISITSGERNIDGTVCGIADSGDLVLKTDSGKIENIMIGEIIWKT